ncbi:hypothetical protein [Pseudomonas chlororaphis]|uniref:hypothetical protein n=1 Tax=Pseudomonas chlororaphis TaxID=587753 RepID=UPI000F569AA0|nr:hypothetical protein [Pseudomonas chlororaphis]
MYDPTATYDVLEPDTGEVFGKLTAGVYADLQFRAGREIEDGAIQGLELISTSGEVIGRIEGDTLVQEGTGVVYPLRIHVVDA